MGKAVPKGIKSRASLLIDSFPQNFGIDFDNNKTAINNVKFPLSKKQRNIMAGYITRKKKMQAAI